VNDSDGFSSLTFPTTKPLTEENDDFGEFSTVNDMTAKSAEIVMNGNELLGFQNPASKQTDITLDKYGTFLNSILENDFESMTRTSEEFIDTIFVRELDSAQESIVTMKPRTEFGFLDPSDNQAVNAKLHLQSW
jgi:hypothetical protein